MIRIAHVLHGWPPSSMGGTGLYVDAIARAQAEIGHPTAIVAPRPGQNTQQEKVDGPAEHWRVQTSLVKRWTDTWNGSLEGWQSWCAQWKPDVVHIHHLSGWPLGLIESTPCRTVLTLHDYSLPCARGQLIKDDLSVCDGPEPDECTECLSSALRTHPAISAVANLLQPFPTVSALGRRIVGHRGQQADSRVQDRLLAVSSAMNAADVILSPSTDLLQRMRELGFPTAQKTDLPLLRPAVLRQPDLQGPVRFLFASTIIPTKGPDRVIDAFLAMDEFATLTIAGHAPDFPAVPNYAKRLRARASNHRNIHWLGAVPPANIPELMANHDVLVLPSLWPENSPLVVREATAAGLQVIASIHGGAGELAPSAILIEQDAELLSAMKQLASDGRMRHEPSHWPTPIDHAKTLLHAAYKSARA